MSKKFVKWLKSKLSFAGRYRDDVELFIAKLLCFQQKFDISDFDDFYLVCNAEVWARSVSNSWLTLDDLLEDIRLQYSIPDLEIRLEDDIRTTTQSPDETITSFIPKIKIFLDRLSPKMSFSSQLDRVYRNLHPEYQKAFKRDQFNFFQELLHFSTAEETRKEREKNYTVSKPPEQYLFPETAHKPKDFKNNNSNQKQNGIAALSQKPPQNKSQSKTP